MNKEGLKFFLGYRVKNLRLERGLSLKELAALSGLSSSYLNEIEKGKKYPKKQKLSDLSKALNISEDILLDFDNDKALRPIIEVFKKGLLNRIPLEILGLKANDFYEILSLSNEKFGTIFSTITDIARSYDIDWQEFHRIILRGFQENNNCYFIELEDEARKFKQAFRIPLDTIPSKETLEKILIHKFNYTIDDKQISKKTIFSNVRGVYKKGSVNKFFINDQLMNSQKSYVLAKEIAFQILETDRGNKPWTDSLYDHFDEIYADFRASYLAGALLLDKDLLTKSLKDFFNKKHFSDTFLRNFLAESNISSELIFHRIVQLLPEIFGIDNLFFLRFERQPDGSYRPSKELHIGKKHRPHGIGAHEHYCERWLTVSLPKKLSAGSDSPLIDIQKSIIYDTKEEYLCLSLARESRRKENVNISITIGIKLNEDSRSVIKFIDDQSIPVKIVGNTCERCSMEDCTERATESHIINSQMRNLEIKRSMQELF